MRIVLADDDELARKYLSHVLVEDGHEVFIAADGAEALNKVYESNPDIVVSDILMPHMDGYSLSLAIKGSPKLRDIPVVFYSATFLEPDDRDLAESVGAVRVLRKDIPPGAFVHELQDVLRGFHEHRHAAPPSLPEDLTDLDRRHLARLVDKLRFKVTELEREKEALSQSSALLETVVTTIPEVVYILRLPEMEATYVSPESEALIGYEPESFIGGAERWITLIHEDDRLRVLERMEGICSEGDTAVIEGRLRHRDGHYVWVEARLSAKFDSDGVPIALIGSLSNIEQRKQTERELHASNKRFSAYFELMPEGSAVHTMLFDEQGIPNDYRFVNINPAFERLTGLDAEKVIGQRVRQVLPELEPFWINTYGRVVVDGEPISFARYDEVLDKYFSVTAFPLGGADFAVIFSDVSEQRRHEEQIADLARFPEENPNPVLRIASDGTLLYANPASGELLAATGMAVGEHVISTLSISIDKAIAEGKPQIVERRYGGDLCSIVIAPAKERGYANLYVRDVSKLHAANHELLELSRQMLTLSRGNMSLLRSQTEAELLDSISASLHTNGGYPYVAVIALTGNSTLLSCSGTLPEAGPLEASESLWRDVHASGEARFLELSGSGGHGDSFLNWCVRQRYEGLAVIPIGAPEENFGLLLVGCYQPGPFSAREKHLFYEVADDTAFGIRALRMEEEKEAAFERLQHSLLGTVDAISSTLEKRDPYTAGHQQRVALLALAIAAKLGMDSERMEGLRLGGIVHDIGKVSVPAEILNRPGALSEAEFKVIQVHSEVGHDILKRVDFPWPIADMVLQHHERMDGTGYPLGLSGDEIILEARILAVADVVEAITSHRPYRPGLGLEVALDELRTGRGQRYDAHVVDACLELFERNEFSWDAELVKSPLAG